MRTLTFHWYSEIEFKFLDKFKLVDRDRENTIKKFSKIMSQI